MVAALVTFNVVMGTSQEMKARASVDALAQLQVPHARVRRAGRVEQVDSTGLVPGDVVLLEAGDLVPADGRIVTSATLEVQEAALTGESAPDREGRLGGRGGRDRAGRPYGHGLPEHPGDPRHRDDRGHRDRPDDPDGPHREHGHRDQAHASRRCSASSTA